MRIIWFKACLLALFVSLIPARSADLASHAFTYQGRLFEGGSPANGTYDLKFGLFDAAEAGAAVANVVATNAIAISNGLFTVHLDFGPAFDGSALWLEISERTNGVGAFTTLVPRQFLATVPYASFAAKAGVADSVPASGLTGPVPDDRLSANVAMLNQNVTFSGLVSASRFTGNGAGLTNLSLPDGSISLAKLASDAQFIRAPYLTGIRGGAGKTNVMRVLIDEVQTDPPASLAGEYLEGKEVIWYLDGSLRPTYRTRPGALTNSTLVLRRKVTSDRTWLRYLQDIADMKSGEMHHKVTLVLSGSLKQLASWEFTNCMPIAHSYRLADDGMPLEELRLAFAGNVTRTALNLPDSTPPGSSGQAGFTSGQPRVLPYEIAVDGVSWGESCAVASDVEIEFGIKIWKDSSDVLRVSAGAPEMPRFTLRQSVTAASDLFAWYQSLVSGTVVRRTVEFRLGSTPLKQCLHVWPYQYRLVIGDDGLPYEEYSMVHEGFTAVP